MARFQLNRGNAAQGITGYRPERVRIGSISVFALVVIICLAVLSVLSLSTANASLTMSQRQATAMTELYQDERAAQEFLSRVDAILADIRVGEMAKAVNAHTANRILMLLAQRDAEKYGDVDEGEDAAEFWDQDNDGFIDEKYDEDGDGWFDEKWDEDGDNEIDEKFRPAQAQTKATGNIVRLARDDDGHYVFDKYGYLVVEEQDTLLPSRAGEVGSLVVNEELDNLCAKAREASDNTVEVTASVNDNKIAAQFSCQNGRLLNIVVTVRNDGTYRIDRWRMSAVQNQEQPEGQLLIIDD